MRKLILSLLLAVCVAAAVPVSAPAAAAELRYNVAAYVAPPHNEPAFRVQGLPDCCVSRYVIDAGAGITFRRLSLDYNLRLHGQNRWRPPSQVGNGRDAWSGSDWAVDRWVRVHTVGLGVRLAGCLSAAVEYVDGDVPYHALVGARCQGGFGR